ncbi:hypothetical protein LPB140_11270 [Sphingorhabdus lutea]|uniref:YihY/virulence factor BrkB family protein n=1 Tax=Sphingorhabdus lutea TaxID=1913578 RepID=A0A1L3JDP6_9SPHN|nr:YihY/virulence factor BrkB family protein [Sphingorhabdus lutea]APG63268.1 hypothetical protein LPB140_11270 [Sphingorhabdus lutea]
MSEHSNLSPEARADVQHEGYASESAWFHKLGVSRQAKEVMKRTAIGLYNEGFIHAGNFAYLALLAIFAFFISATAIAGSFGQSEIGQSLVEYVILTVPPRVGETLREPIFSAMHARSGGLLWLSALVGLWTTTSLIETIRDILHRAYGTEWHRPFWQYRLSSILVVILSVILSMLAFGANVFAVAVSKFIDEYLPDVSGLTSYISFAQLIPFIILFITIYMIFRYLSPLKYSSKIYPKWPGAALVSCWWVGCTTLMPYIFASIFNYDLTYGSLGGVMIVLIFFYVIGFGIVAGAHLNAALANKEVEVQERLDVA